MKTILRVCNMRTIEDVTNFRNAISNNQGVVAFQVNMEKGEVDVLYDRYFVDVDKLIDSLDELGYIVL
jgi:copper chaperone